MPLIIFALISSVVLVGVVFAVNAYYKEIHERTSQNISDAEIFKLMARANHFITDQQLASATGLSKKDAGARLGHLSNEGALKRYYDSNGAGGVFQLLEDVPLFESLPAEINGLSEQEIIDVILLHVDDHQITLAELCVIFDIDVYEAKEVMKRLKKADLLTTLYKSFRKIYAVKKPLKLNAPVLRTQPKKKDLAKLAIPEQHRIKIPDADVLQLAIDHKGRLTPTLLCVKLQISMDEAKMKLENLYDEGAFVMDVDEENAVLEYRLADQSLLK